MLFIVFFPAISGILAFWIVYRLFIGKITKISRARKVAISTGLTIYVPILASLLYVGVSGMIYGESMKCTGLSFILMTSIFWSLIQTLLGLSFSLFSFSSSNLKISIITVCLNLIALPISCILLFSGTFSAFLPDCS